MAKSCATHLISIIQFHSRCKFWHYPKHLPKASVVIVFHNEGWTTLLRTVHSVLNTSPKELLEEIILVDDFSNTDGFEKLKTHIKTIFGNIRLHKTEKREGLVQARTIGAKLAKGEVIVILDAHCECVVNWLPPLLARIKANRYTLSSCCFFYLLLKLKFLN
jgi:polypeptide N-acetylgalactosaminyltransferase